MLGIFIRGWFLKLILIIIVTFILLRAIEGFASFAARLDAVQFTTVVAIALTVLAAYRKRIWKSPSLTSRRNVRIFRHRLTKENLTPKGIETGHVVFSARRKGFRTLKFIEIRNERPRGSSEHIASEQIRLETVKALPYIVALAKKLRVELSYELHWCDGTPQIIVAAICEGRQYRRCRALVDEFAMMLAKDPRLNHIPTVSIAQVDDDIRAEKILMLPVFPGPVKLINVDSDSHNVVLTSGANPSSRTSIRIIQMLPSSTHHGDGVGILLDLLLRVTRPSNPVRNLVCQFHVKNMPSSYLRGERKRLEKAYELAIAHIADEVNDRARDDRRLATSLLFENDRDVTDATSLVNEVKTRLIRLRDAEESGIFGVTMTIIGEPATVENTARQLKSEFSSLTTANELRIQRLPPIAFQAAIERISTTLSAVLVAKDVVSLMAQSRSLPSTQKASFSVLNTMDL